MNQYDVIIIGAGLGGLVCGTILSKEGFKVCVLEKNSLAGGCFQTFKRHGRFLDTGIHYIGSMDEGQILRQYFTYLGIMDQLRMRRMDEEAFDVINYRGHAYSFAMGHERFADTLAREFPKERDTLRRYARMLSSVGSSISVDHLKQGNLSSGNKDHFLLSAWKEVESLTPNPVLREVLTGSAMLYGGIRDVSTFYHHAIILNSYLQGAWRFVDGSMQATDALADVIRRNGGDVFTRTEVSCIHLSGNRVSSVAINGTERLEAPVVISSLHPLTTMRLIDKTPLLRKATFSRLEALSNSYGFFSAYLLQRKNATHYVNRNHFILGDEGGWSEKRASSHASTCMLSMQSNSVSPNHTDVINLISPMPFSEVEPWAHTTVARRGEDYELFKQRKAEALIALVERYYPGLTGNTEQILTTTPLSYLNYTGSPEGSAYGIMKDYKDPLRTFIPVRTRVPGLLLTGQNLNVHGALGVVLTATLTCAELVGAEYLAKKIGNA